MKREGINELSFLILLLKRLMLMVKSNANALFNHFAQLHQIQEAGKQTKTRIGNSRIRNDDQDISTLYSIRLDIP